MHLEFSDKKNKSLILSNHVIFDWILKIKINFLVDKNKSTNL